MMLALVLVCDPEESFLVFLSNAGLQRHSALANVHSRLGWMETMNNLKWF